ncbi:Spermidine/putrescine ABC transporter, periplasmic spermidine/putrescine-binding protein [Neisseria gonorrhoeae]|uniref:Spermidine/putrescine ABC transporter, periplasmic spermidine/putrescine-binding protein n=1 Tax=Neisseria gonorrhoeae TaxID=485 RepID=A0A378VZK7_NEIGO|nr:Spermidine/putrescine ABC transporter, periplasmic spermidine/putrescine-binding protein [Neisseria gonorrhoeae]
MAAKNGSFVTYAPASRPARELMDENTPPTHRFPDQRTDGKSFIVSPKSAESVKLGVKLWQGLKAGK